MLVHKEGWGGGKNGKRMGRDVLLGTKRMSKRRKLWGSLFLNPCLQELHQAKGTEVPMPFLDTLDPPGKVKGHRVGSFCSWSYVQGACCLWLKFKEWETLVCISSMNSGSPIKIEVSLSCFFFLRQPWTGSHLDQNNPCSREDSVKDEDQRFNWSHWGWSQGTSWSTEVRSRQDYCRSLWKFTLSWPSPRARQDPYRQWLHPRPSVHCSF